MDDGPDDRRRDVAGAQDLLLSTPPITIFNAWADEPWVNDGAAVRVSLVCFGLDAAETNLNGLAATRIHADLTSGDGLDLTLAALKKMGRSTSRVTLPDDGSHCRTRTDKVTPECLRPISMRPMSLVVRETIG